VRGCRGIGRVIRGGVSTVGGSYWRETEIFFNSLSSTGSCAIGTSEVGLAWNRRWEDGRVRILLGSLARVLRRRLRAILGKGGVRTSRGRLRVVRVGRVTRALRREGAKRLAVSAKKLRPLRIGVGTRPAIWAEPHIPHIWVDRVSWNEGLRLRRDGCEDTLLLEALAI
jgi:hypothetical protein